MHSISWENNDTSGFSSDDTSCTTTGSHSSKAIKQPISRHQTQGFSANVECWRAHISLLHLLPGMVEVYQNRHHSPAGDSLAFFKWMANQWVQLHSQWLSNCTSWCFDNGLQTSWTQWQHHLAGTYTGQNPSRESQRSAAIHWLDQSLSTCFSTQQPPRQGWLLDNYAKHTGSGSSTQHLHYHGRPQHLPTDGIYQGGTCWLS